MHFTKVMHFIGGKGKRQNREQTQNVVKSREIVKTPSMASINI